MGVDVVQHTIEGIFKCLQSLQSNLTAILGAEVGLRYAAATVPGTDGLRTLWKRLQPGTVTPAAE